MKCNDTNTLRHIKKLYEVLASARTSWVGSQSLSFLTVLFNMLLLGTSAWLIASAALHPNIAALGLAIVGVRFYGISRALCRYGERYISHNMAFHGLYDLRLWLYRTIMPLRPTTLGKIGKGDLLSRLMGDIELLQFFFLRVLIPPVTALLITICFAVYLSWYSMSMVALLLCIFVVGAMIIPWAVLVYNEDASARLMTTKGQLKVDIVESLNGMLDIIAYNQREYVKNKLDNLYREQDMYHARLEQGNHLGKAAFLGVVHLSMLTALVVAASILAGESIESLVYIAVIAISVQAYFEALQPMIDVFRYGRESLVSMSRIQALEEVHEKESFIRSYPAMEKVALEFKNVNFSYTGEPLLSSFCLQIKEGEKVAIVGASGSGKSTLFALLERLLPYDGAIFLYGKELQSYSERELRQSMTVLDQQPYIFHASLEDNIRLANPTASSEEVQKALQFSALDSLVSRLPKKLDTVIGQGGMSLSGGEIRRLALARMYLHQQNILLLDEPLEGLDEVTASSIYKGIQRLWKDRTALMITHRMQGLEQMDRILFFSNGMIIEEGTYQELMDKKGLFYHYVHLSMLRL